MDAGGFAAKHGTRFVRNTADPDGSFGSSSDILEVDAIYIRAGKQSNCVAGADVLDSVIDGLKWSVTRAVAFEVVAGW